MKLNQPLNKLYVLDLLFISAFSVIFQSTEVSAEANYPEIPEATIFDGYVKASISYDKDHSPNYTAVGDTVTVTTT